VNFQVIEQQNEFDALCKRLAESDWVGFDTEFVSEDCYRPDLCLIQVATRSELAIIDPIGLHEITPFWDLLLDPARRVVVHAGREEVLFCFRATGQVIPNLFDIQLAAGFVGMEYPASYGNLLQKILGHQLDKGETRTDWRARPLSAAQLQYAAEDVAHLDRLHKRLETQLDDSGRSEWLVTETTEWLQRLVHQEKQEQWHRLSGAQSLTPRGNAILRELWLWRHKLAAQRNIPPRRLVRDDLLVEMARRASPDPKRIANLRGMHHSGMKQYVDPIAKCIERGLAAPEIRVPKNRRGRRDDVSGMVTQLLSVALATLCRSRKIASQLVATSDDLREWAEFRLAQNPKAAKSRQDEADEDMPRLLSGWRGEIFGNELDGILHGDVGVFVRNLHAENPLELRHVNDK
jgi:ribonuclease D